MALRLILSDEPPKHKVLLQFAFSLFPARQYKYTFVESEYDKQKWG
jgi:hypothetical protein